MVTGVCGTAARDDNYVGFEVLTAVAKKSSVFWDMTPCSPLKINPETLKSTLRMEATRFSETLVDFQRTTRFCIPKEKIFRDSIFYPVDWPICCI
jgi:hypothetical protein